MGKIVGGAAEAAHVTAEAAIKAYTEVCQKLELFRYVKQLSVPWAAALAIAGGLAVAAAGAAPVVVVSAVGAVFGAYSSNQCQGKATAPGPRLRGSEPVAPSNPSSDLALDDVVRASVAWALVLELQGNPEETIAGVLTDLLDGCCLETVDSMERVHGLLDEVGSRLQKITSSRNDE